MASRAMVSGISIVEVAGCTRLLEEGRVWDEAKIPPVVLFPKTLLALLCCDRGPLPCLGALAASRSQDVW